MDPLNLVLQTAVVLLMVLGYYFVVNSAFPQISNKRDVFLGSLVLALMLSIFTINIWIQLASIAYAFFLVGVMRWGSAMASMIYSPKKHNWSRPAYFVMSLAISMSLIIFIMKFY